MGAEKPPAVTAGQNIPLPRQFWQFLSVRVITKLNVLIAEIAYALLLRIDHRQTQYPPPEGQAACFQGRGVGRGPF